MTTPENESTPSFARLQELLHAAAEQFRAHGYTGSTTREIAEQLGWQKPSIYYYVKSKEELLYLVCSDCLRHIYQEVSAAVAHAPTHQQRLQTLILTHMDVALAHQDQFATTLLEMRHLTGRMLKTVRGLHDDYEQLVERILREAQTAGVLRADVPPKYLMLMLLGMLNWSAFWYKAGEELTPKALGVRMLEQFLAGAQARP